MSRTTHRARREQKRRRLKLQNLRKRHYLQRVLKQIESGSSIPVSTSAVQMISVTHRVAAFEAARHHQRSPRVGRNQRQRRRLLRSNPHLRKRYR